MADATGRGSAITRSWVNQEGVNAILDVPFSSVALAVNEVTRGSAAACLDSGPGAVALTGKAAFRPLGEGVCTLGSH